MAIPYTKLRGLTARQIMSALERDGFDLVRVRGSHHRYHHPDSRRVTLSFHRSSDTFKFRTLKSIIELQAKWTEEDLKRLKLLKD